MRSPSDCRPRQRATGGTKRGRIDCDCRPAQSAAVRERLLADFGTLLSATSPLIGREGRSPPTTISRTPIPSSWRISGARSDRPELAKLLKRLEQGDVLIVTRLDRLARSTRDLLNILDMVSKAGAGFKSLGDNHGRSGDRGIR
jgi:Resolvase, N terminal domain